MFSSSNTPITSSVLNDIEYLNNQLWIATGAGLHIADDFERSAIALTIGDPSTCDLDSVIVMSLGVLIPQYSGILVLQSTFVALDSEQIVSLMWRPTPMDVSIIATLNDGYYF